MTNADATCSVARHRRNQVWRIARHAEDRIDSGLVFEPLRAVPDFRPVVPRMMPAWQTCPVAVTTLLVHVRLLGEDFRGLDKTAFLVVLHELRCEGMDPLRGDGLREDNEKMEAAMPVGIEQERMESSLLQFCVPAERGLGVGLCECRLVLAVLVDIMRNHLHVQSGEIACSPIKRALVVAAIVLFDNFGRQSAWPRRSLFAGAV